MPQISSGKNGASSIISLVYQFISLLFINPKLCSEFANDFIKVQKHINIYM